MVITVEKKEFADAVNIASRFAERRSVTLPVLAGIAIIAGDDGIKLRATNLETGIDLRVEGTITDPGVIALPATVLREITSSFGGNGSMTLEHAGETAVITSDNGTSTLKTLSYEDFPILPLPESPKATFTLSGEALSTLIGSVVACASTSTVRPELASVLISAEGGVIKAVATDSFRLAEKKSSVSQKIPPFSMLIPAKNAVDILQALPEEEITISIDDHQCSFSWKEGILTTRLVANSYPDYSQIIPKSFVSEATVLRKDMESALRRVAVFSDAFQKVRLAFSTGEKRLVLSARNNDIGESSERIPASVSGESIELSFNHRYLSTPLTLTAADSITVSASGMGRAAIIRGTGDTTFLYLVMPMNQ
ncbi:MAG: DNA polymerase III subunit beta [Bacillota bacterium]